MRIFLSICRVLAWVTLVLTTLVQIGTILSVYMGDRLVNPLFLVMATILMVVSVIMFFCLRRGKLIPLLTAAVAGIVFILTALHLKDTLSVVVTTQGLAGISLWKAMYRHMTPALIPLFLFPVFLDYHTDRVAILRAEADARTPQFFDTPDEPSADPRKQKRSVRARVRKEAEDAK